MEGAIQPTERSGHSCVIHEGIIYIWGGQRDGRYFNDLFLFNISSGKSKK
jgi:alpha-tubulin suppressor-like RCC1 family protein